jgi:hypothetical protein
MRSAPALGGLALLLACAPQAVPQTTQPVGSRGPDVRYVIVPEAYARAGPSDKFYPTNALRRGERVEVVAEGGDWLAIRPPEGSFSWINTRHLQNVVPQQPNYVVTPEGVTVPILIGSSVWKDQPTVEGLRLQRGTQVRSIGPPRPAPDGSGSWMPVESPAAEKRYLPASAVSRTPPSVVSSPPVAVGSAPPGVTTPPLNGDVLWRQAQQAEQNGQIAAAIQLYEQAGKANLSLNPERAMAAYERARALERSHPSAAGSFTPAGYPSEARYSGPGRVYPLGSAPEAPSLRIPQPGGQSAATTAGSTSWSDVGYLRPAGRRVAGQGHYQLEDSTGRPIVYVTPQPGLNLDAYCNSNVRVYGTAVFNDSLRAYVVTATSAEPAR